MTAFNVPQTLRGFDSPPPPPARGLIGIDVRLPEAANDPFSQASSPGGSAASEALIAHRQSRPTFESLERMRVGIVGMGAASDAFGRAAFAFVIEQDNDALALFRELRADAEKGFDINQARHLEEVKAALDAERAPGSKLFR